MTSIAHIPQTPGGNNTSLRPITLMLVCLLLAMVSDFASAQGVTVTTGTSVAPGADAWAAVKSVWFGPMGLVGGVLVFALAVYYFFKDGVLATLGVLGIGIFFFFVPAISISVQTWAKTF